MSLTPNHKSNRCAPCDTNWPLASMKPPGLSTKRCPSCNGETFDNDQQPDHSYSEALDIRNATQAWATSDATGPTAEPAYPVGESYAHRRDRFMELGFHEINAGLLATATVSETTTGKRGNVEWATPLHHMTAAAALEAGMTHDAVVQLYA